MDTSRFRRRLRAEGQTMVLFALFSFVLLGAMALALDVGFLLSERREAQAAADAAALAGARALLAGESTSGVTSTAQTYAASNGLATADGGSMNVNVTGTRWDGTVSVDLAVPVQKFFLGALYTGNWSVTAHAVADISNKADARYALIALDPPGITVGGGIQASVTNGSIISNSDILTSGDSSIVVSDGFIDAVGSVQSSTGWYAPWGIRDKRAPVIDPFAAYAPPSKPAGAPITGNFKCNPNGYEDPIFTGPDCTFSPGYYKNANIRIWDRAVFQPGLYYFENTSIQLRSTTARIEGVGVNFYFTGNPNQSFLDPQNGEVYLTAPGWSSDPSLLTVHGDYRDMVIWIDMCPGSKIDSQGNQEFFLGGVVYAPCSALYLHGNPGGDTVSGIVIGSTIHLDGASDISVTYLPYGMTDSYEVYLVE